MSLSVSRHPLRRYLTASLHSTTTWESHLGAQSSSQSLKKSLAACEVLIVVIVVLAQNCGELWGEQTRCIGEKERDEEASIWRAAEQT